MLSTYLQSAINDGKIDASYIMCGHKDVVTGSDNPGISGLYTWVKDHTRYGKQSTDGGVSKNNILQSFVGNKLFLQTCPPWSTEGQTCPSFP